MRHKQRLVIAAVIAVLVLGVIALGWRSASDEAFSVVKNVPAEGSFPTSSDTIIVEFNKPLKSIDEQFGDFVSFDPALHVKATITEKTLMIELLEDPPVNSNTTLSLTGVASLDGGSISETIDYFVEFIPYSELSDEVRELQAAGEGRPKNRNPLLSKLPYDEISFRIDFEVVDSSFGGADDWREEKDNYVIVVSTYVLTEGVEQEKVIQETNRLRQKALDWIREQEIDPENDINLLYIPADSVLYDTLEEPPDNEDFFEAPSDLFDNL